jgi:hypothetical protein
MTAAARGGAHPLAGLEQGGDKSAADESGGTEDERGHESQHRNKWARGPSP